MSTATPWSPTVWGLLLGTPVLVSLGQVLFKCVGLRWSAGRGFLALLLDPYFVLAMAVYAAATLSWIVVLRIVPLGLAYAFTALGFVVVPLFSTLLFGEELGWRYVIGLGLVISGLIVIHG